MHNCKIVLTARSLDTATAPRLKQSSFVLLQDGQFHRLTRAKFPTSLLSRNLRDSRELHLRANPSSAVIQLL